MNLEAMLARMKELRAELDNEGITAERIEEIREERASLEAQIAEERARIDARQAEIDHINSLGQSHVITPVAQARAAEVVEEDPLDTIQYRTAFKEYVLHNTPIPAELRANAIASTTDAGVTIPTTVMNRIIEEIGNTGMIINDVTRTSYKGGVQVPTASAKPSASWVNQGAGSDTQKKTLSYISFSYHKLRCAVAVTLEVDTMALAVFEQTLVSNVVEAMVKAIERSIFTGSGSGQPKGFLTETVVTGQNIDIAATGTPALANLEKALAALPQAYESGVKFYMTKKTFFEYASLKDTAGQPIGRVNYGIGGATERILLGVPVVCNDYMSSYAATVTSNTIVAALFNPKDYILNTNLEMRMKKYEDDDTDDMITKAIMLVDGKAVDVRSLVTITKKSA